MNKRKLSESFNVDSSQSVKLTKNSEKIKKNSLDSDEEDDDIDENDYKLHEDDIEGEEDGVAGQYDDVRTTAFNMKEELEEGHFDKDGHYIWKKEKEIKDNWLDNIDWQTIKKIPMEKNQEEKGLGESSDEDDDQNFELMKCYKDILTYMNPSESISKTLQRLGKSKKKLSTIERIKLKKAGILDTNEQVVKLTELVNNLLTRTGNMDIYQETFENISKKIRSSETPATTSSNDTELDMYSDDFGSKEKQKLDDTKPGPSSSSNDDGSKPPGPLMWEYKLTQDQEDKIEGPFTSEQMQKWVDDKKFDKPIFVRKVGQEQFYSSSRIDFELYIS